MDALPPSFTAEFQKLERRIVNLERANKLLVSTITGGTLRVLDADGVPIAAMGVLPSGSEGVAVQAEQGDTAVFYASKQEGLARPWLATSWREPLYALNITSGTFADVYTSSTELLFSLEILFRVRVVVAAGSTGEMRVMFGGNVLGGTQALADGSDVTYEYRKAHGVTMGGGPVIVALQVRRASGGGNVSVTIPEPLHWGSIMGPDPDGWV